MKASAINVADTRTEESIMKKIDQKKMDRVLKRMLATPPDPHIPREPSPPKGPEASP
jgi:hypothetical protein